MQNFYKGSGGGKKRLGTKSGAKKQIWNRKRKKISKQSM